jgi:hypothetical protein
MAFKDIVRLSKERMLSSLAFSAVLVGLIYLFNSSYRAALLGLNPGLQAFSLLLSLLIGTVIYYPLACGLLFIYRHFSGGSRKKKKHGNRDLAFAIVLIAVFNPITYSAISTGITYVNYNVINHPCGLRIEGFQEVSPARDAGMKLGEAITEADGRTADTSNSLSAILSGKKEGDTVYVKTDTGDYVVGIVMENGTKPIIGIIARQIYCSSALYEVNQTVLPGDNASLEAFRACQQSCIHTLQAGDNASLQNGPCLLDPIPVQPDWVCDIAHSPRLPMDNLPENQCSFYLSGKSVHFIELSPGCRLLGAG